MAEESGLSTIGVTTPEDYAKLTALRQYTQPVVSPWVSMGIGGLMGLYAQHEQKKQYEQDRKLAATTARLAPYTGMRPNMNFRKPSLAGNLVGGVATGLGTAKSINEYSAAKNIQDAIDAETARNNALAEARSNSSDPWLQGPRENPWSNPGQDQRDAWSSEQTMPYMNQHGSASLMEALGMAPQPVQQNMAPPAPLDGFVAPYNGRG